MSLKSVWIQTRFYKFGVLNNISMVAIKKISKKYTKKRIWNGNSNSSLQKIQVNTREDSYGGKENLKSIRHTKKLQQNGTSPTLSVITVV